MTFPDLFDQFSLAILPPAICDTMHLRFQSVARYASARAGDAPFTDNDRDQIVFVASGSTKLVAHASQGREQIVAFHFAGDLVTVPARGAHAYSLFALESCDLIYFPADDFFKLARSEAAMIGEVFDRAMRALAGCREKTISLGRKSAQERLASFLVTMADRIGVAQDDGCVLDLPMSRRDIADSLGLTIETVSRQLGDLRNAGLLETAGRSRITIRNFETLNACAGHLPEAA